MNAHELKQNQEQFFKQEQELLMLVNTELGKRGESTVDMYHLDGAMRAAIMDGLQNPNSWGGAVVQTQSKFKI